VEEVEEGGGVHGVFRGEESAREDEVVEEGVQLWGGREGGREGGRGDIMRTCSSIPAVLAAWEKRVLFMPVCMYR